MADRRPRRGASPNGRRHAKPSSRNAKRHDGETIARAELRTMREIIVVLVQAITDLFDCLPKDVYATEKIVRIEATLARVQQTLAERQRHWASDVN